MRRIDVAMKEEWANGIDELEIANTYCVQEVDLDLFDENTAIYDKNGIVIGCHGATCLECWESEY